MLTQIHSVSIHGLDGHKIEVEVDITLGMPNFNIVGLADVAIQESKERVRTAIRNSGFRFPSTRITVNLAPADIRKRGPCFDLPIAIGILGEAIDPEGEFLKSGLFLGELALDGALRPVNSILPSVIYAKENGFRYLFLPEENVREATLIPGVAIIGIDTLATMIAILSGEKDPKIAPSLRYEDYNAGVGTGAKHAFASIIGQEQAKRALLISASGGHNILMEGPPGSGKTMLAKAISSILPPMELSEVIETSKIYSVAGLLSKERPLILKRPFRRIHHTASTISIVGGGRDSRPGEISLAHKGVLFLDEFLEFESSLIETLRQPMEDGEVTINRVNASYRYPAKFILVGALNPCPCGFYQDKDRQCTCSQFNIDRYRKKLSGPILDRIDIFIKVPRIRIEDFNRHRSDHTDDEGLRRAVLSARGIQLERFSGTKKTFNSEMDNDDVERHCPLGPGEDVFIKGAVEKLDLSTRAYFRTLKLARTIADLEGSTHILLNHLTEALSYRGS